MKKINPFIQIFIFTVFTAVYGQKPGIQLTFTGEYYSQYVLLDSIFVENLTQGGDTILYAPETVLVLDYTTGFSTGPFVNTNNIRLSQNRPNPFTEKTLISIFLPEADNLKISVINLYGQKVAFFKNSLDAGKHLFSFYPGSENYYILSATVNSLTKTIKMVNLHKTSDITDYLIYLGPDETQVGYKSIQGINDFVFSFGDQLRFTGFAKNNSNIIGSDVIVDTPEGNENYLFEITEGIPCPGSPTVNYEGKTYNTLQIGTQCWFKENLNVGTMLIGNQSPYNNGIKEKNCYNDNPSNCNNYGGLYRWNELMQYTTQQGTQGICKYGWHIPTDAELTALTDFLGGEGVAGAKMKELGTLHWNSPNTGATNESGFTTLPGGQRYVDGFVNIGDNAYFWCSTEGSYPGSGWARRLDYNNTNVLPGVYNKDFGFSVRCLKDVSGQLPTVTTVNITNITETTASGGGNVTAQGSSTVVARGVCWSTSSYPTIADPHTFDGTGNGSFTSQINGLNSNTLYYVHAYATNGSGTAYGNQVSFTSSGGGEPCPGIPTVTYEGQTYNTEQIGSQCWFRENLNVGTMIDGSIYQLNNSQKEKYCYDNDPANCTTYGGLYQWNEMMQYSTQQGIQGICPAEWHIPDNDDWTVLTDFLGGENIAGGKMKETGTTHWNSPNTGATNESGFTALPGGFRNTDGGFGNLGAFANFFSSTQYDTSRAWARTLGFSYQGVGNYYYNKQYGFSVRCLKD